MTRELQKLLNQKIVVFGTGQSAEDFCKELWFADVEFFFDNDQQKWNHSLNGKLILAPEKLKSPEYQKAKIIVASMYYNEIAEQLTAMDFMEEVDFFSAEKILFQIRGSQQYPAGHYYSSLPDYKEAIAIASKALEPENILLNNLNRGIESSGINLNTDKQLKLLELFGSHYYQKQPFGKKGEFPENRYYFGNRYFENCDAITLYCMLRHLKPKRIVEIGSGFSSAVMLDVNERFFENKLELFFIEPYPERLNLLLNDNDKKNVKIVSEPVQFVDLSVFRALEAGDILFIDSTHVSKIGSDVNHIVFNILPLLKSGVFIHFHDIFFPFVYPLNWIEQGRFWNETYLLRAFLQYNNNFSIRFWSNYLNCYFKYINNHNDDNLLVKALPLCERNIGGSLWLEKVNV